MLLLGTHMMDSIKEKVKIEGLLVGHIENCWEDGSVQDQIGCSLLIL